MTKKKNSRHVVEVWPCRGNHFHDYGYYVRVRSEPPLLMIHWVTKFSSKNSPHLSGTNKTRIRQEEHDDATDTLP